MNKLRKRPTPDHKGSPSTTPALHRADTEPRDIWMANLPNTIIPTTRSKTMTLAMAPASALALESTPSPALPGYLYPRSPAEQYWAARALTAETLLAAKAGHRRELKKIACTEDVKRVVRIFVS
ncbi:hypothetical protein K488DRAFT_68855 [Vararia minispora EC-137]|uniref:Uncharacterized protein n=1 Tax=Vararia minispora EC-137 TaxID=1314806 RepID=A0ACB8QSH3_9AGAM|nr:hypothetical protein K488DRAFT_68855 [Vararia minispora EC-137]